MSDLPHTSDLLTLGEIAGRIPGARGAGRLHPATITRWILRGAKAIDGTVVRLAATRVGSRWLVRAADLSDFFAALAAPASTSAPSPRTPTARQRAANRAAAALKAMGA